MKRLMIPALAALVAGCGPTRVIQEVQKDSVSVVIQEKTVFRDSIVYVQIEPERESVILADTDTSRLSTRYAESEAYVSEGRLFHSLRNRSEALIPIETKIPVTIHFESRDSIKDRASVEIVEVEKQLSRWQRFIMALGYVLIGLMAGWIALKLAKIIRN